MKSTGKKIRGGVALAIWLAAGCDLAAAQTTPVTEKSANAKSTLAQSKDELSRVTEAYKQSLRALRDSYQTELTEANAQTEKLRDLVQRGLIAPRDLQAAEAKAATLQAKIKALELETTAADEQMADMLAEAEAVEREANTPVPSPAAPGRLLVGTSFVRFTGLGAWSLSNAWKVQSFFQQKFGRPLPIAAFGQSKLHDAWHWDHRNAMDVNLNPLSTEGQALMAFLRANGIPFGAFTHAIPGVATGPHIHVGMPSHRLAG